MIDGTTSLAAPGVASRLDEDLRRDVRAGLSARPRRLPSYLLYDERGSALFERITRLPEYYLTRAETEVFERHAEEICRCAGPVDEVFELGAGSARKTVLLLRAMARRGSGVTFIPIDVSPSALREAAANVARELPDVRVQPVVGRYGEELWRLRSRAGRKLVAFIGSSMGNFDPEDAVALLDQVRAGLNDADMLLLGADLTQDPAALLPAYADREGVTAEFNRNVLVRLNRELGADFNASEFVHRAVWNGAASRVEMHLEAARAQKVNLPGLGMTLHLARGERIHTESSYKLSMGAVDRILRAGGFARARTWRHPVHRYADHLAFAEG